MPAAVYPLVGLSLVEAAGGLRAGDFTAERYASALLAQCEVSKDLGAFITLDPETVRRRARAADRYRRAGRCLGPLHGVPLAVKDNFQTRRLPTSGGAAALAAFRPADDAAVLTRLGAAGALLLGKANLHELSMGWTSTNAAFGAVRNPYVRDRIAGGSSGGTAAAVAARLAPAGLGSDTNGSLRIPAALCGITSLRPSSGRYPVAGLMPLAPSLDVPGPMARTMADLALLDGVLAGRPTVRPREEVKGVRIGVVRAYYFAVLRPEVAVVIESALDRLRGAGAEIVDVDLPELATPERGNSAAALVPTLIHYEAARALRAYPAISLAQVPDISESAYREALVTRQHLQDALQRCFVRHRLAALAYSAVAVTAPPISPQFISPAPDIEDAVGRLSARDAFGRNAAPAALAGLPAVVLPAGLSRAGLPAGLEFAGPRGGDEALLGLAFALETALGPIAPPPTRIASGRTQ